VAWWQAQHFGSRNKGRWVGLGMLLFLVQQPSVAGLSKNDSNIEQLAWQDRGQFWEVLSMGMGIGMVFSCLLLGCWRRMVKREVTGWFKIKAGAVIPTKGSKGAVGWDLCALAGVTIGPGERILIDTGVIGICLTRHFYGRIAPRSGLAWKQGVAIGAGVIDSDYRGEIRILIFNHSAQDIKITEGDRVAQLIVESISCDYLPEIKME